MRIYFVGSDRDVNFESFGSKNQLHQNFSQAATELGRVAAACNHRLLLTTDSEEYIDFHILRGALRFAKDNPSSSVTVEYYVPHTDLNVPNVGKDLPNVTFWHKSFRGVPEDRWISARVEALANCDFVLMMGGAQGTATVGTLALNRGIPVTAYPCFGGPSRTFFERIESELEPEECYLLSRPWEEETAKVLIKSAERIAIRKHTSVHSYFLSYSHEDASIADHLEVLLSRSGRLIMRDDAKIAAGTVVDEEVKSLIGEADTFLAVYSENYIKSPWCMGELDYVRQYANSSKRVIMLCIGNTKPLIVYHNRLHLKVCTRNERELAIRKLLDEEVRGG